MAPPKKDYTATVWTLLVVLSTVAYAWNSESLPGSAEVSAHELFCIASATSQCDPTSSIYANTTYRPDVATNSVTYWVDSGAPRALHTCAIKDKKNWVCGPSDGPTTAMQDGQLSSDTLVSDPSRLIAGTLYQMPKWKWTAYKNGWFAK
jgi:hypothetical protein